VHRFGQFLSIKAFVLEVLPQLKYVKELKLNLWKTFLQGTTVVYPSSLKSITLLGFAKVHIESFLAPIIGQVQDQSMTLSELTFSDLTIHSSANVTSFFEVLRQIKVHTLIFNSYEFDLTPSGEPLGLKTSFNHIVEHLK
jgi:hypothetical protein